MTSCIFHTLYRNYFIALPWILVGGWKGNGWDAAGPRGVRREYLSSCRRRYPDTFKIDRPAFILRFVSFEGGLGAAVQEMRKIGARRER